MSLKPTYHGHWHSPDYSLKSHGYLRVEESKVTLSMMGIEENLIGAPLNEGLITAKPIDLFADNPNIEVLVCETKEGRSISLYDLRFSKSTGGFFDSDRKEGYYEYIPRYSLIGNRSIENPKVKIFKSVEFEVYGISRWMAGSIYSHGFNDDGAKRLYLLNDPQNNVIETSINNLGLKIIFRKFGSSKMSPGKMVFLERGIVEIQSVESNELGFFLDYISRIHTLINFLSGKKHTIGNIKLYTEEIEQKLSEDIIIYESFQFLDSSGVRIDHSDEDFKHIFRLESIKKDIGTIVENWLTSDLKLRRSIGAFVSVGMGKGHAIDTVLTEMAGIIESVSKQNGKNYYIDRKEYKSIVASISSVLPNDIDQELKEILLVNIKRSNEYTLQSKSEVLITKCWPIISNRINLSIKEFARAIANNRNALIHNDEGNKDLLAHDPVSLYWLSQATKWVAYASLSMRLGINEETVIKSLRQKVEETSLRLDHANFRKAGDF